jgi:glycosyltransferase involved in cell wall biosynthesis
MTYMISRLNESKGEKFNLVQGHEIWMGQDDLVHDSYSLRVHPIVIARYLQVLVEKYSGTRPPYIPVAINHEKFRLLQPIEGRNPLSVLMLYSEETVKGTQIGLQALSLLKDKFPSLEAHAFGVYEKPDLPTWIQYHHKPVDLPGLMNRMAVFFAPSNSEGWALPPAEALCCGCALVCTDIGGHADYAFDGESALLAEPGNAQSMMEKLKRLIEDPVERIRIAKKGNEVIQQFNWENAVAGMERVFYEAISGKFPAGGKDSPAR